MRNGIIGVFLLVFVAGLMISPAYAQSKYPTISYKKAGDHVDQIVRVQGTILKIKKAAAGGYLFFSNNESKYVRVLIPTDYLQNFEGDLKYRYVGKKVEVLAKVQQDGHRLLLVVGKPKYIKVLKAEEAT